MKSFARILSLSAALFLAACASHQNSSGWITLFDGTSTEAFRGYKQDAFPDRGWKLEDGLLKTIVGGDVVDLMTKEQFQDFELSLEWRISPGGNSGIVYRVAETGEHSYNTGPEMQVLDDAKHKDGMNPKTSAGALYALIAPTNKVLEPVGEWNHARLIVRRNHVEHWLNGRKVVQYELGSEALKELIAGSKFKDMPGFAQEKVGHICLQHHLDQVWYRNIKIRRM